MSGYPSISNPPSPVRRKTEAYWSGLTGRTFAADTNINLVNFLKALPAPSVGALSPFFNTTSNKLNVYNEGASLAFKVNISGTWSGGSTNRSMQLDFLGTNGNRLVASRDVAVTADVITLATFFSIDKNGFIALNGTEPIIRSNGGTFTVSAVLLIAEQVTSESSISAI